MSTVTPTDWQSRPAPRSAEDWIARAAAVAAVLATDAAARDHAGATPYAEVQLLKDSGLVTLLGPVEHGGAGQDWPTAYRVVREVAKADGSIGQLLGYHYLWNWAARLVGTREQWEHVEAEAARNRWFFGGAVNPRDKDVVVTEDGDDLVFTGRKSFSTGSKVSDVTVLEGVLEGTDQHVFAIVPSDSEGLTFLDDWDNIGQRLTESGGVTLDGVRRPGRAAAGYVDKVFQPRIYNTLNVPTIQLVFVNFYLGIASGALDTAATYTRDASRGPGCMAATSAPSTSRTSSTPTATSTAKLWAVEALADTVAAEGQRLHEDPDAVTEQTRGGFEVRVAAVKARATDVGPGGHDPRLRGHRRPLHRLRRGPRPLLAQCPHPHPPRPGRLQAARGGPLVPRGELPEPTWYS